MHWTTADKEKFLVALQNHGCNNLEALTKEVPFKSTTEIRAMIAKYKAAAKQKRLKKKKLQCRQAPIDNWMSLLKEISSSKYTGHLYRALKYIILFERHTEMDDINLKDCYQVLADAFKGLMTKTPINDESAYFYLKNLADIAQRSLLEKNQKEKDFLEKFSPDDMVSVKSYSRKNSIASLVNDVILNPLKVPANLLSVKQLENS